MKRGTFALVGILVAVIVAQGYWLYFRPSVPSTDAGDPGETTIVRTVKLNGELVGLHCAGYRTTVKYGDDPSAWMLNVTPRRTTISKLTAIHAPKGVTADSGPIRPVETTTWRIRAFVQSYQLENDQDYHLRLLDSAGNSMVAELSSPLCTPAQSPLYPAIARARTQFYRLFGDSTHAAFRHPKAIWIEGPGFWDFPHGGEGIARNGIEIHPVTAVTR